MFEYFKKNSKRSSVTELFNFTGLDSLLKVVKKSNTVKSVNLLDSNTLSITTKEKANLRCMLKDLGDGKIVLVTMWQVPQKEHLTYYLASTLWNDNKAGSHQTSCYITQQQLCVMESHLNLSWGVSQEYLVKWIENYFNAVPLFEGYIENTRQQIKQMPEYELSLLDKIEIGGQAAEIIHKLWKLFD